MQALVALANAPRRRNFGGIGMILAAFALFPTVQISKSCIEYCINVDIVLPCLPTDSLRDAGFGK
jgi:hypothetical protein